MNQPWYSISWFSPQQWQQFHFENRLVLYAILGFALLFLVRSALNGRARQQLALSSGTKVGNRPLWQAGRYLLPGAFFLGVCCILTALARPQIIQERREEQSPGIDIMLAIDVSSSMAETDLKPNRLAAARRVAEDFVRGRKSDRIGLVAFAGEAFSLCPLTTDYTLLRRYLTDLNQRLIPASGTAIGDALGRCINRMRDAPTTDSASTGSKVVILLSDGENTAGNIDPMLAAKLSKAYDIRIYTIAVGRPGTVTSAVDSLAQVSAVDEGVLKAIARTADGSYYRATDARQLKQVFSRIDRLEKAPVRVRIYQDVQEYYRVYLNWGILFLLGALLLKSTIFGNVLED